MGSDWKNGVVFNALIHKLKPDLVNMEEVRQSPPKVNLEKVSMTLLFFMCFTNLLKLY